MSIDPLRIAVEREMCEQEHLFFTRRFFLPRMGFKFAVNWHSALIADKLDAVMRGEIKNIVFNVPPGSGKTELCGGNLVAHGLARNPRSRFLYLSYSDELVTDVLATARNIVTSDEFQAHWPISLASDSSAKSNWKTQINGFYAGHAYGAALGGQITGRRAGVLGVDGFSGAIVIDDPIKPEDAFSEPLRKKAVRKLINTVASRKAHPDVPVIMIMQRLHVDDPTGAALNGTFPGDWEVVKIPALIDDDYIAGLPQKYRDMIPADAPRDEQGRMSYWPAKESLEFLLQLEKGGRDKDGAAVSRYTYTSQYQQEPRQLGGGIIKSQWFSRYQQLPELRYRVIYADTAQKTKERNDYSVFECWGLGKDGKIYLIDMIRGKWEAPELRRRAIDFWNKHLNWGDIHSAALTRMKVEDKASGTGLVQDIKAVGGIPVSGIEREKDKLTRVMDVVGYMESGLVCIPECAPFVNDFLVECDAFTADDSHQHDDQIDPMCDAINDMLGASKSLSVWAAMAD